MNYILGNPPFQASKDESKGKKIYLEISKKMMDIYEDELLFITPIGIANKKMKRISLSEMPNLAKVDYTANDYFDVGVKVLFWQLKKNYNGDVEVIEQSLTSYRQQKDFMCESHKIEYFRMFDRIKKLGSKQEDKMFIGDVSSNGHRQSTKSDKYCYEINVNTRKNKKEWTYKLPKLHQKKKLAVHMGVTHNKDNCIISTENFGQYQNMVDINDYTDKEIENLKKIIYSDIVIKLSLLYRETYEIGFNNFLYFIRKIDRNIEYDDKEIIKHFELTEAELKLINLEDKLKHTKENTMSKEEFHYSEERDDRVKETGEVFTPDSLVQKMLDSLDIDWSKPPQDKTFLDPTMGSGNFLVAIAKRGIPLNMIYGVDLMDDNVETTRKRLTEIFGDTPENKNIMEKQIIQGDALKYDYDFGESEAYMDEW